MYRESPLSTLCSRGFTLVETLMVIVLIGVVGTGILLYFAGMRGGADPLLSVQALELAQEKMEEILSDKKASGFGYIVNVNYPAENPVDGVNFPNFNRSTSICFVAEGDLNDTGNCGTATDWKRIGVTVSWTGGGQVDLVTILSNH